MEQINIPEALKVEIDFQRPGIPYAAQVLHPLLFKDGDNYCCILGPNLQEGVAGLGKTPEQAIQDWDKNLTQRIKLMGMDDGLAKEVKELLQKDAAERQTVEQNRRHPSRQLPATVTQDRPERNEQGVPADHLHGRRNTADQSNADGSEYR